MLDRIEFRSVGRQTEQFHIPGRLEFGTGMPTGPVEHQDDAVHRMGRPDFIEEDLHAIAVSAREDAGPAPVWPSRAGAEDCRPMRGPWCAPARPPARP